MTQSDQPALRPRRPYFVTILTVVVLSFTYLNAARLWAAIQLRSVLTDLSPHIPVTYLMLSGAVWALIGLPLAYGLYTRKTWASRPVCALAILYALVYWFDRLFLADPAAMAARWPFAALLTVILLSFTFYSVWYAKKYKFYS